MSLARLELPRLAFRERIAGNTVTHLGELECVQDAEFVSRNDSSLLYKDARGRDVLLCPPRVQIPAGVPALKLRMSSAPPADPSANDVIPGLRWLEHPANDWSREPSQIVSSWADGFLIREEDPALGRTGLREAQVGAIHAVAAHWTVDDRPATVVLPTGMGKTESMLSVLVHCRCPKVLVLVPSDVLRAQLHGKFCSLGRLRELGLLSSTALPPRVALIRQGLKTSADAQALVNASNVLVATAAVLESSGDAALERLAKSCSHLFVDEAHHLPAKMWDRISAVFSEKRRLHFTATPFRRDGRYIEGKIVYNYPLSRAQQRGYFRPVRYAPVDESVDERVDQAIAKRALEELKADRDAGLDHLILARVGSIDDADNVARLYADEAPEFAPVVIHSKVPVADRNARLSQLNSRTSRVLVCVDMFGEGFDLPQLKIAAMHSIHKSLPITLQFVGRFTRAAENVGDAAVVVNIADPRVDAELESLYEHDSDWNDLLRRKSEREIEREVSFQELIAGFEGSLAREVPLWTLRPKSSTVAFKVGKPTWRVNNFVKALPRHAVEWHASNAKARIAICVFAKKEEVRWGRAREMKDWTWHLALAFHAEDLGILFLHLSEGEVASTTKLARALVGKEADLICGPAVFRVFHGVERPMVKNLGTAKSGRVRFTMYFGPDVSAGLSQVEKAEASISNVFGWGFEAGNQVTYGCSIRKGKVWSLKGGRIHDWTEWCRDIGAKLADESINDVAITAGFLRPEILAARPDRVPIAAQWGESLTRADEDRVELWFGGTKLPLSEVDLRIAENSTTGPIRISCAAPGRSPTIYELTIGAQPGGVGHRYVRASGQRVEIRNGRSDRRPFEQWMEDDPIVIMYADGSFSYNEFFVNAALPGTFDPAKLRVLAWTGTQLNKEAQGHARDPASIQYKAIEQLLTGYDFVFDDDAANEAADIIALRKNADGSLHLHFVHCKYTSAPSAGARVDEFYELCGQAQKCVSWKHGGFKRLAKHMRSREAKWAVAGHTRYVRGGAKDLRTYEKIARSEPVTFEVTIVQPGLSKAAISDAIQRLLGTTELYLKRTADASFQVVCSA